jgi:hypothetical protein
VKNHGRKRGFTWHNCPERADDLEFFNHTLAELRSLLVRRREASLSVDELLRFHSAKRLFNGRIAK